MATIHGASLAGTEFEIIYTVRFYFIPTFQTADFIMNDLDHKNHLNFMIA